MTRTHHHVVRRDRRTSNLGGLGVHRCQIAPSIPITQAEVGGLSEELKVKGIGTGGIVRAGPSLAVLGNGWVDAHERAVFSLRETGLWPMEAGGAAVL